MTRDNIQAVREAFARMEKHLKAYEDEWQGLSEASYQYFTGPNPSQHAAAAKRASMDLTKALADLRRPGYRP